MYRYLLFRDKTRYVPSIAFVQRQSKICSQYRICLPYSHGRPSSSPGRSNKVSLGRSPLAGVPSRCTQVSLAAAPGSPQLLHPGLPATNLLTRLTLFLKQFQSQLIYYFNKILATNSKKRLFRCEYFSLIDLSPSFNPSLLLRFGHAFRIVSALPGLLDLFCFSSQLEMNYCQQYICRW